MAGTVATAVKTAIAAMETPASNATAAPLGVPTSRRIRTRPVSARSTPAATTQVSLQWKNPDFLFRNPDFLIKIFY